MVEVRQFAHCCLVAKYVLAKSIYLEGDVLKAGKVLDDTVHDIGKVREAGGVLLSWESKASQDFVEKTKKAALRGAVEESFGVPEVPFMSVTTSREWDDTQFYDENSVCCRDWGVYVALRGSQGKDPRYSPLDWNPIGTSAGLGGGDESIEITAATAHNLVLSAIPSGGIVEEARLIVLEAFSPGASLMLGTSAEHGRVFGSGDVDLSVTGQFEALPLVEFDSDDVLTLTFDPSGSSGRAILKWKRSWS